MHTNTDSTEGSIVLDGHRSHILVDGNGNGTDLLGMERVAVDGVDQDFIKNFQESWGILEVLLCEGGPIENPVGFRTLLDWTDIGVRSLENVFDVGELLDTLHTFLDVLQV